MKVYQVLNNEGNPAHDDYIPVFSTFDSANSWLDLIEDCCNTIGMFIVEGELI